VRSALRCKYRRVGKWGLKLPESRRIGHVHVAYAGRVGLDRFVLDPGRSEALDERVEPGDGEGDAARARPRRVRLVEPKAGKGCC
jgi:sugar phosphate isomerase/epimerase